MAIQNLQKAYYAKQVLKQKGLEVIFDGPSFNEFVIKLSALSKQLMINYLKKILSAAMISAKHIRS